jgi:hypothetical protein
MTDKITQINDEMSCEKTTKDYTDFRKELSELINKHSLESGSHTPDFVLSNFLVDVLICFDAATISRNSRHDFPARLCVLERERDQWRECAEERKQAWYEMQSAFERIRDEVNALERERDQWRECAERLAERLNWWAGPPQQIGGHQESIVALREFERLKGEAK